MVGQVPDTPMSARYGGVVRYGSVHNREVEMMREAALAFTADELPAEELPRVATEALVRGISSPSLQQLAGLPSGDVRDTADLFQQALDELGISRTAPEDAHWTFVLRYASDAVDGRADPVHAADMLCRHAQSIGFPPRLKVFELLIDTWKGPPNSRRAVEHDLRREAHRLLIETSS
ncbi:hypothetical protein GCM10022255_096300 [Dactylosporangium darangshiense]|uniref:Uncharacterized protein n=2 Tax=Dactylosporangium darangshiense TaxID=579108 RepID=A0ABP8DQK6_9ACTN